MVDRPGLRRHRNFGLLDAQASMCVICGYVGVIYDVYMYIGVYVGSLVEEPE